VAYVGACFHQVGWQSCGVGLCVGLHAFLVLNIQLLTTYALPLCPFDILGLMQRCAREACHYPGWEKIAFHGDLLP